MKDKRRQKKCKKCGCALNLYNGGDICSPCSENCSEKDSTYLAYEKFSNPLFPERLLGTRPLKGVTIALLQEYGFLAE